MPAGTMEKEELAPAHNHDGAYGTTSKEFDRDWAGAVGRFLPDTYYFLGLKSVPMHVPDWTKPSDDNLRLFPQDWLERLTVVHWSVPLIVFLPIVAGLFAWGLKSGISPGASLGLAAGGVLLWSLAEYALHRFAFHYVPTNRFEVLVMFFAHGIHHTTPDDPRRLVMPPVLSLTLAVPFYLLFKAAFGAAFPPALAGFFLGYLCYDMAHFSVHHVPFKAKWFNRLRKHHMLHHFATPHSRFGVSSTLWDHIFRTHH